jgi:hypothetical protein
VIFATRAVAKLKSDERQTGVVVARRLFRARPTDPPLRSERLWRT